MTPQQKKDLVRRYYDEVWSRGQTAFVDEWMADDYENCDPATPGTVLKGRDAFKGLVGGFRSAFSDLKFDVVEQHADGDVVVTRWTAQGTHDGPLMGLPATGRRGQPVMGVTLTTFRGDRIVRDVAVWDLFGLLKQLGAIPS